MRRLEGSGWKFSYVAIKKFQLQPLKVLTLKSEGLHSWISSSVFWNLRTRYVHILHNPARLYNWDETGITILQHKHTKILVLKGKRQISSVQSAERGRASCDSRQMCESIWTLHSSVTCISKKVHETRTHEWHTAWINPCVPSFGVDTERGFSPSGFFSSSNIQSQQKKNHVI